MSEKGFEIEIRAVPNPEDTCYFSFTVIKIINNKYTAFTDSLKSLDGRFFIYDLDIERLLIKTGKNDIFRMINGLGDNKIIGADYV